MAEIVGFPDVIDFSDDPEESDFLTPPLDCAEPKIIPNEWVEEVEDCIEGDFEVEVN